MTATIQQSEVLLQGQLLGSDVNNPQPFIVVNKSYANEVFSQVVSCSLGTRSSSVCFARHI